jgi:hypothetical protein
MSEAENIAQTIRKVIQDLVAPEVREIKADLRGLRDEMKVRFDSLEPRFASFEPRFDSLEHRFESVDHRFDGLGARSDAQFKAIMAALGQIKAESELSTFKAISALSERVAALELYATRHCRFLAET